MKCKVKLIPSWIKNLAPLVLFFLCYNSFAQALLESRQISYYTYIYKITDKEAAKVYKKDLWKIDETFFHTLVDSFPTDSMYSGTLDQGHYLKTLVEKNNQKVSITTIQDFNIFIFNNNTDLCIQINDLKGNIIRDAEVKVRWKKLSYDKDTQTFTDKKSNQKGLVKVTYNGFTTYFNLSREYENSYIKRGTRQVLYGTPVKYVWRPINFAISLPIDGVKSIVGHWPQGTIYQSKYFINKSLNKISCLFDGDNCDEFYSYKFKNRHTGYLVFNKPIYAPEDSVKFKAFLVNKRGKPVNKKVNVELQTSRKNIKVASLEPYSQGGYKHEFFS